MEQKIYDLNEYSLEVKDGKAVLKRKGRECKAGDFICFGDNCIGIYNRKSNSVGKFWTRCFLDKDKFTSYCSEHPYTNVRLASEEEKKRLLAAIDKGGFIWDSENLTMKKKFDFEDGAFVADADGDLFIHWKGGDTCYSHGSYVYWNTDNDDVVLERACNMTTGDRLATREEVCALFDRLAKVGLEWDRENKITKKKRWRAKKGKEYWHAEFGQGVTRAFPSVEMGREVDDFRYEQGNYYMSEYDVLRDIDEVENKKDSK